MKYKVITSNGDVYEARILRVEKPNLLGGDQIILHQVTSPRHLASVSIRVHDGMNIQAVEEDK